MKIYFIFQFTDEPKGGVFQFTKALREYLLKYDCVTTDEEKADLFYMSSHQHNDLVLKLKWKYPNKPFIHRIDGPIRLYNTMNDKRDLVVNLINNSIADGTIFQSIWSREKSKLMGINTKRFEATILNAPNPAIFNSDEKCVWSEERKIRVITTSWSSNWKKGFEVYRWLDDNLDFTKYEFTFIGNSPIAFKNIQHKEPLESKLLAQELQQHDIFITASQKDPCSNSLIEALHCGLPAIGLNDGGHPEIIGSAGEIFTNVEEIPKYLEKIGREYISYQKKITLPSLEEVGKEYYDFFRLVYEKSQDKEYKIKELNFIQYITIKQKIFSLLILEKIERIKRKFMAKVKNNGK